MKSRNRTKSMLLALLLSLSMIVTYFPAWMIVYATEGDIDETAIEMNSDTGEDIIADDTQDDTGGPADEEEPVVMSDDQEEEEADAAQPDAGAIDGGGNDAESIDVENVDSKEKQKGSSVKKLDAAVEEDKEPEVQTRDAVKGANGKTVLAFTSDTHNASGNSAANRLGTWLEKMKNIYGDIDVMAFGGDMASASVYGDTFWTYTQADIDVMNQKGVDAIYTTGNHEYMNGYYQNGSNITATFIEDSEVANETNYRIYCLGTSSYRNGSTWNLYDTNQINTLTSYLNSVGNDKPIFIITHYPLHWTTSRTITNSGQLIDALNNAAATGKKIVFLWGHNHTDARENDTGSETHYDEIFAPDESIQYASGSWKTLQFYYAAAGCMSDSDYGTGSGAVKGKGLIVTIDSEKKLSFTYHDANGNNVTEEGTFTEQDPVAVTGITVSPGTATVEAKKGTQLTATVEPDDATNKGVTWSSSDTSVATVSTKGRVKGVTPGTATITATSADGGFTASCTVTVTESTSDEQYYIIKIGNYVLSTERSSDQASQSSSGWGGSSYTYTGLAAAAYTSDAADDSTSWVIEEADDGSGYYIKSLDGLYLNATYTSSSGSWPSSGSTQGDLKLDETPDVWVLDDGVTLDTWVDGSYLKSTNASNGQSSAKYLAEETGSGGSHLFTVRSKDNADETTLIEAEDPTPVTGVSVSPEEATVEARKTVQLTATVAPENATNKSVTWSSSDTSVATVDGTGKVRGVKEGRATITVTTADGGKTAEATVTVTPSTSTEAHYVIVIENYALSVNRSPNTANGGSSSYTYTGLAGKAFTSASDADDDIRWIIEETTGGYYIKSLDGKYLNATYESGSSSGKGDLKIDDTPDVWVLDTGYSFENGRVDGSKLKSTNASGTATSDKFLSYEDSQNLFSVRSSGNADEVTIEEASDPTPVTGVSVSPETATVEARKTVQLTATVAPENATNKAVTWSSSDTSVATVDGTGKVRGVKEGTATITVTTADGGKTAEATVTVTASTSTEKHYIIKIDNYALSTELSNDQLSNNNGQYIYTGLKAATYTSATEADDTIRWIIEETEGGYYIKSLDGRYLNATYTAVSSPTADNPTKGILKLDDTPDVWVLDNGVTLDSWEVNGSYLKTTNASTSSKAIYLAEETGANGTHLFTVRSSNGYDQTTIVEAEDPTPVTGVSVSPETATVEARKTVKLTATVAPDNATNKNVTWSSSDTSVATVDENGTVRGVKEGTATITVTTADGGKTAEATVTVTPSTSTETQYVIVIDGYAMSINRSPNTANGGSSSYTYTGLAGVAYTSGGNVSDDILWTIEETNGGYYIKSLDGKFLNATYESGSNSGKGDLKVDNTPDVWVLDAGYSFENGYVDGSKLKSTNASATATSDKFLSYEDSQNLFSVRSSGNADEVTIVDPSITIVEKYIETDTLADGKEYIIAYTKDTNTVYAVKNVATGTSNTNTGSVELTVVPASGDDPAYIETKDAGVAWKYTSSDQYMTNRSMYLNYSNSRPQASTSGRAISYSGGNLRFHRSTSGSYYYLTCSDGTFGTTSSSGNAAKIRLFVKTVEVVECDHTYGGPAWTWTGSDEAGYTAATATFTCSKCGEKQTINATVTNEETAEGTVYTATAAFNGNNYTDTKTVAHVEVTYTFVNFTWTGNDTSGYTAAKANYTGSDGSSKTVNAAVTSDTTPAGCETEGSTVYTATVTAADSLDGTEHSDNKTVKIDATGHDWNAPTWSWTGSDNTGYTSAEATFTCKKDSTHKTDVTDSAINVVIVEATSTIDGSRTYTAIVTGPDGKTYTDVKEVVIPATGYTFKEPVYSWEKTGDGYSVSALKECNEDAEQNITETVNAVYSVKTPTSCEVAGVGVWTATFNKPDFEKQTKEESIPATGHHWNVPTYTWAADYSTVTAMRICQNDASHVITETVDTTSKVTPATCEEKGKTTYTARFGSSSFETQTQIVENIPALGHDWEFVNFTWTGSDATGYTAAVANYKCRNDETHTKNAAASVTSDTTPATCETAGETVYTATVTAGDSPDGEAQTGTRTAAIPAFGHKWSAPEWTWTGSDAEGYTAAKATFTCANDNTHTREAKDTEIDVRTVPATPTVNGSTTYTASVTGPDEETYTDVKEVVIPATGYTFKDPVYSWEKTGDGYSVSALKECNEDAEQNITETADAVFSVTTPATCEAEGTGVWTATFSKTDFETQTRDEAITATGHDWNAPIYAWSSNNGTATATRTCKNDAAHIDTESVNATSEVTKQPTCETKGETTYIAVFKNAAFETQTKTVEDIDALGHSYGEYKLTRAAKTSKSGLLTRTCSRCNVTNTKVITPIAAKAVVASNTTAKISWIKVAAAQRYQVYFASCSSNNPVKLVKTTTDLSYVKKGLTKGTFYKFVVRAQRKIDGKWVTISNSYQGHFVAGNLNKAGTVTNVKSISVAKTSVTLKAGKATTIKPGMTLVKAGKKVVNHAAEYRYMSTDTDIATVSSAGKITAKKAGKCKVYVVGVNGVYKAITVTVN